MKLLVTGGMGFIGSNFVRYCFDSFPDVKVACLDNLSYGSARSNLSDVENRRGYSFIEGDIADQQLAEDQIKDADCIVNFAAESHVDRSISNPVRFLHSNTVGVFSLLEALRKSNREVRLLQVSTDETYGSIPKGSFDEQQKLNPSSPYAATKASADVLCMAFHRTYGVDVVVSRCTNNFGAHQFPEKLIPKTIIRALLDLKVPLYGRGRNVRDWIYVEDHCEALARILQRGRAGEIYNISSGDELENIEVVSAVLEIMKKPKSLIQYVEDRPGHDLRYSLDSQKVRDELGWRPKHPFGRALAKTVEWYVKNEDWWRPLADQRVLHPTPWKLRW